jgi:excinuclease ABC subunit C
MKAFDRKFGTEFLSGLPASPGIYRFYDADGALIYVGKARNLKRRLAQYKNAKRLKKHRKMRAIVADAVRVETETCTDELAACLAENRWIQERRPRWNVAGAFHFLYPMIGMRRESGLSYFVYSTTPERYPGYAFHGAFRSRQVTRDAYFSLMRLLGFIGHAVPRASKRERYSRVTAFRQLPEAWLAELDRFFTGESRGALESLVLALVENAGARAKGREIQDHLNNLGRFWRHEALPLRAARRSSGHSAYPVAQADRDAVFLRHRLGQCEMRPESDTSMCLPSRESPRIQAGALGES